MSPKPGLNPKIASSNRIRTIYIQQGGKIMFEGVGEKLKIIAKVGCWLGIASGVIIGIVLMIEEELGLGFSLLVSVPLVSWISSLFTYGFGELIENSNTIASNTRTKQPAPQDVHVPAPKPAPQNAHVPAPKPAAAAPDSAPAGETVINEDGSWTCGKCHRRNTASRTTCWSCDTPK
jgi:hypothetical protein